MSAANVTTVATSGAAASGVPTLGAASRPSDTAGVLDIMRGAVHRGTRLRVVARGTWLDAGRPVAGDATPVALDALTGIVDYTPGDLTLTARAGTTLAEIAEATRPNGQWLALTPWGGDRGSLGATAATASAGPVSGVFGTPRDVVIGLEAVAGTGDVIRGGGRVVKNVAGFDLTRLMIGAWGTLGIITEVSVRLRGLPERDSTLALAVPSGASALADLLARLRTAPIAPIALEIVDAAVASRLGLGSQPVILARVIGNDQSVSAEHAAFAQLTDVVDADGSVWDTLRSAEPRSATVVRLSSSVARFSESWHDAVRLTATTSGAFAHASVLRAVTRVVIPNEGGSAPASVVDALGMPHRGTRVFERLPADAWPVLAPTMVVDKLSNGVRAAFDPHRLINPGILGEDLP